MKKIIIMLLLLLFPGQLLALEKDDFSLKGNVQFNSFFYTQPGEDQTAGQRDQAYVPEGIVNLKLKVFLTDDWQWQSELESRYNYLDLERGALAENQDYRPYLSLEECYLRRYWPQADLYLGIKKINWGITDRFNPIDLINPVDLTDLIYDRKIGLPLLAFAYYPADWQIEAVVVPYFIPSRLPPLNSYFYYGVDLPVDKDLPQQHESPWQFGLRLSWQKENLQLVSLLYSGYDALPFIEVDASDPWNLRLVYHYEQMQALGGGFVYSIGQLVLRGEGAYYVYPDMPDQDYGQYVVGGDYNFGQVAGNYNLYLTMQYIGESPSQEDPNWIRHFFTNAASAKIIFGDDFFSAAVEGIYNFPNEGTIIIPSLAYTFQNNLSLQLEYNYFSGETESFWEFMEQNQRFIFRLSYKF